MVLRDSIEMISTNLCRRTVQSFRSFYLKSCLKLPKQIFCIRTQKHRDHDTILFSEVHMEEQASSSGGCTEKQSPAVKLNKNEGKGKECEGNKKLGTDLAKKMRELEMMDHVGDMEHLLDAEEALYYYSRLKSPVYIDIVDSFFNGMHKDFPNPSASKMVKKSSTRRFGSIRL